jgi:8-oxo-dGTP pyrophosphatase MutT (NUDIX family)
MVPIVPSVKDGQRGVILVERSNTNGLAFPGGFAEDSDNGWEHALCRELQEETGIVLPPTDWEVFGLGTATVGNYLIFCEYLGPVFEWDGESVPENRETKRKIFASSPTDLCFPTHTEQLKKYLSESGGN